MGLNNNVVKIALLIVFANILFLASVKYIVSPVRNRENQIMQTQSQILRLDKKIKLQGRKILRLLCTNGESSIGPVHLHNGKISGTLIPTVTGCVGR